MDLTDYIKCLTCLLLIRTVYQYQDVDLNERIISYVVLPLKKIYKIQICKLIFQKLL